MPFSLNVFLRVFVISTFILDIKYSNSSQEKYIENYLTLINRKLKNKYYYYNIKYQVILCVTNYFV